MDQTSCGLREEPNSIYGDRAVSSINFYAGIAIITRFYFPHGLTNQCHDLRKGIKQLRYQLVLLSPFLDQGSATSLNAIVNALKTFQDILGNLQDLAVIRHLLMAFLQQKGLQPEALQTCFQILDQEYLALWQQWQPHQTQYLSPSFRFELRQHFAELSR